MSIPESFSPKFETLWGLGKIGKFFACLDNPIQCGKQAAIDVLSSAAYNVPKKAVEILGSGVSSLASGAYWGTRTALDITSNVAQAFLPIDTVLNTSTVKNILNSTLLNDNLKYINSTYASIIEQTDTLSTYPTSWITGKSIEQLKIEYAEEAKYLNDTTSPLSGFTPESVFRASDLIGSTLLLNFFINSSSWYVSETCKSLKLLMSFNRLQKFGYTTSSQDSFAVTSGHNVYSTNGLLRNVLIEGTLSALSLGGACLTTKGIYDAIAQASTPEQAQMVVMAITIAFVAIPKIYDKIYTPSISNTNSPSIAPNLAYTDSETNVHDSSDTIITIEDETPTITLKNHEMEKERPLSFEERMNIIRKYEESDENSVTEDNISSES